MATLKNLNSEETVILLAQHIFGRHPGASSTVLNSPNISRMHAAIYWDGENWSLQDSSTNGTYLNGNRVPSDTRHPISKNDKIQFANLDADVWQLVCDEEPKSMLVPETKGSETIVLDDIAVLPNEEQPEVTLFMSPTGDWICESDSGVSMLSSGDLVGTNECVWRFIEAKTIAPTLQLEAQAMANTAKIGVLFEVSQNEEHVALKITMDQLEYDLGERNHHYLLLLLARARIADKERGIDESEQGWIEKEALSQMLGQSETHINIQVYRFRKQLIKVLPQSLVLPQVIERRTGEIRFLYDNINITGGIHDPEKNGLSSRIAL